MKHLWKHLMCTALCLCLLFSAALAEAVDINLHVMTDYTDADAWTCLLYTSPSPRDCS